MRRRSLLIGVVAAAIYLVALAATVGLRSDHVRPLYDGFSTPTKYRWVDPPSFFASGNTEPAAASTTIRIGPEGSAPAGVATPDGQFVISLGRGAIAPPTGRAADAKRVAVHITPVAPDALAPVPDGLRANGNAYRVEVAYRPQGGAVGPLDQPGSLVMEIPELGDSLFFSADGTRWSKLASRVVPPRNLIRTASLAAPGYYLGATNLPELVASDDSSSDRSVLIGVATAVLAAVVLAIAFVLVRRRRRRVNAG